MDRDKKILVGIIAVLIIIAVVLGCLAFFKNQAPEYKMTDALRFKEEYESYNGKINEKNKMTYPEVLIEEENPIKYMSDDEVAEFLKEGTGVIYFGFSSCPWCRSAIPMLFQAAKSTSLGEIIYVDIQNIRDSLILDDKDNIVVTDEGTNGYKKILEALDSVLEPFYLTNQDGEKIDTKEKRLYAPTVITVKEGEILDIHVDTVKTQKSGYTPLSQKEQEELFGIYQKMILGLLNSSCNETC